MLGIEVTQPDGGDKFGMGLCDLHKFDEDFQVLKRGVLRTLSASIIFRGAMGGGTRQIATHIVPMELQELNAATEPSRSLLNGLQHIFRAHRLADRTKDAPFCRRVDRIPHISW